MPDSIVALAGGVGAARFLEGLAAVVRPERITIIGNTGDDLELHGLHISPDLDIVAYTLAGIVDTTQGWGIAGDTFHALESLGRLGVETWFRLGDRDLATHIYRTRHLRCGRTLSEVTAEIARALGVRATLLPMSDDRVRTLVHTDAGTLEFQDYFVKRRCQDEVRGLTFDGVEGARPAPGVIEAIRNAGTVIVCPSNPLISIGPILAVPGVREALRATRARVAAISPIVGGRALKGPADRMMRGLRLAPSARTVAEMYRDFVDVFVIDQADAADREAVERLGLAVLVTDTVMSSRRREIALAEVVTTEPRA